MLNIVAVNGRLTTDIRVSVALCEAIVEYLEKYSSKGTLVYDFDLPIK